MKIDMRRDYWTEYYKVRKRIENGEGRANPELYLKAKQLMYYAKAQSSEVKSIYGMLLEQ